MAAVSGSLADLLRVRAQIAEYTQMQMFYSSKYENNAEKLQKQVKFEESWWKAYDNAQDADRTSDLKFGDGRIIEKGTPACDELAEQWADYKVDEYDEELSLELADLDIEYDTMKTMYDTMLETLRAQEESLKGLTSENAQDTGLLNAG